jgi:hypothetical protein
MITTAEVAKPRKNIHSITLQRKVLQRKVSLGIPGETVVKTIRFFLNG